MKMSIEDRVIIGYLVVAILTGMICFILFGCVGRISGGSELPDPCGLDVVECPQEVSDGSDWSKPSGEGISGHIRGIASHYDYILDSGWSSEGHFVCAIRHQNSVGKPVDLNVPRGTILKVTEISTGKSVECLVTDYGPDPDLHPDRVVDLSSTAFQAIKPLKNGLIQDVMVEVVE